MSFGKAASSPSIRTAARPHRSERAGSNAHAQRRQGTLFAGLAARRHAGREGVLTAAHFDKLPSNKRLPRLRGQTRREHHHVRCSLRARCGERAHTHTTRRVRSPHCRTRASPQWRTDCCSACRRRPAAAPSCPVRRARARLPLPPRSGRVRRGSLAAGAPGAHTPARAHARVTAHAPQLPYRPLTLRVPPVPPALVPRPSLTRRNTHPCGSACVFVGWPRTKSGSRPALRGR